MYTYQSGQQTPQVGNPSQYGARTQMAGIPNKPPPSYMQARPDRNHLPQHVRADVSQVQNVQFTSHNGVYHNGQVSHDQALRNPQHGPAAPSINTSRQTQTTNAQYTSHSTPSVKGTLQDLPQHVRADVSQVQNVQFTSHNGVYYNGQVSHDQALRNPQHGPAAPRINTSRQTQTTNAQYTSHSTPSVKGILQDLLVTKTTQKYWPEQNPIQPNSQNSLQISASTPDHGTIYNKQTITNYTATAYMSQQLNNSQKNLDQNVNTMARQHQSQNSTFIQDAQILRNGTLESGAAYNQQLTQNPNHSRRYRVNETQLGSSPHVASPGQMPSHQSFTSSNYAQMATSSNQVPSPQSFASCGYTKMTHSSGVSSNRMSSSQSFASYNQMTNSCASSNQMSSSQSFPSNTCVQMTNSAGTSSQLPPPQSFTSNGYTQMSNSSDVSLDQMSSPQSFTSNNYTRMTNSLGAPSSQLSSPQSFTSNGYTKMTNSLGAPSSQLSSPQSLTKNSYVQIANSSTSIGTFLPQTSVTPPTKPSGRENSSSSQAFMYPSGAAYHKHLNYSKMNSTNAVKMPAKADNICPVNDAFNPGNSVKSVVKDNNTKHTPAAQSEGYPCIKRLKLKSSGSHSSRQSTSESSHPSDASHASVPVQKGFYVTVTEDQTGFKADNVIFLGNKLDTSRFTKESVHGSSANYSQLQQFPQINQQKNDKQIPLQSNVKLPETTSSTVRLMEQRAVAVVQPLSQTFNQVSSMQEHSQLIHGQCKNGTIKEMDGNLDKSCISPQMKDDPRVSLAISKDGTKVSEDTERDIVRTDISSTKLYVAENTHHADVDSCESAAKPQLSVTTEVSVRQTGENNSVMQEDADAIHLKLSMLPTIPWTFEKLMALIETTQLKCEQLQSEDFNKKVVSLYWEENIEKLKKDIRSDNYPKVMSEVKKFLNLATDSVIVSQVDCSWDQIKDHYQIISDDYVHPEVTYTSSWLNTNEQLDNIDKEFGFPPSLKYCPDKLESDDQSKLGSDDETAEITEEEEKEDSDIKAIVTENVTSVAGEMTIDSNDPFSELEIRVMLPDEAKFVFDQMQNDQAKSQMPATQSEKMFSDCVVNDSQADTEKPEGKDTPDMQEFCCVIKCIAIISGKPDTKCQCKQEQDCKGLIMDTFEGEHSGQREKLVEQCTEVGEIISLSDDDDDDVMRVCFPSVEPESISLPSTSSMDHSSIVEKETEIETSLLTSEAEGHCKQAKKYATDLACMSLGIEEEKMPSTNIRLRESSDTKLSVGVAKDKVSQSKSPEPNNTSIVAKPITCKRTVSLEYDQETCEKLAEQCTDLMETTDLTNHKEMQHHCSNSEPGIISLPTKSSMGHSCSSSIIHKGTNILSPTKEVEPTLLTTREVGTTVSTSKVEHKGQDEQNPAPDAEDEHGQSEHVPADKGHISFAVEEGPKGPCPSNNSSNAKVCFHDRDSKINLSSEAGPKKRKRTMEDDLSPFQKKMKRCKQSSLSSKSQTFPLGKPKHKKKSSMQENNMDVYVKPVTLALFGYNSGKPVLNGRGINRDICFSDTVPKLVTVNLKTWRKTTPVVKVPNPKPQIFEDPTEYQATKAIQNFSDINTMRQSTVVGKDGQKSPLKNISEDPSQSRAAKLPQILTADMNTWKKRTHVKSLVKQYITSDCTTVKQRIHNEWKKTVVPTRVKHKGAQVPSGKYMVTFPLSEGQNPETLQPTNVVKLPVCSERRLSKLLSCGTKRKKQSLRLDIQKSLLHGYKIKKNKSKETPVKCSKPSDSMGSPSEKLNHSSMPKERIVSTPVKTSKPEDAMESECEKRIILKFSVLPSTFNFKDGSTATDSLDTPDLVRAQDRISKTDLKEPKGDWALVPSKKYCPLPSTTSAVPKETTTFHKFQKKYLEAKQPSGDE